MKFDRKHLLLYAVTDRAWTGEHTLYEQAEAALRGGATCLQLREKDMDMDAFANEAAQIRALCHRYGVPFLVNDSVEVARRAGADGVHVGQRDMPADKVRARWAPAALSACRPDGGAGAGSRTPGRRLPGRGRGVFHLHQARRGAGIPPDAA